MSITRNRVLLTAMLLALPLICFSQQPEQIVKQYVSLLDNFLMSPNSSSKRMAFENAAFLQGCYFKDDIYIKYKNDSRIEDCMAKDYAGLLSNAINANRSKSYANVKIARDLSKSNNGGINEVTAYLQYSGAIEMRTVTVFHVKDGKIIGLTNDFIKTKDWILGDNHHDQPVVIDQNQPIVNNNNISGDSRLTFTVSGVSFDMIKVSGGTFSLGSTDSEAFDSEKPVHSVTLSDFYIGETEVTCGLWKAVMGNDPSFFKKGDNYYPVETVQEFIKMVNRDNYPVETVSWNDCQEFIKKLNQKTGRTFRLPTEAEWEYAARGGNKSRGYKYSGSNDINFVAFYTKNSYALGSGNSAYGTHIVKSKSPNELGLYDMSGNVCEWCNDWYGSYSSSSQTNPQGASSGASRVLRGGSWDYDARYCRSSYRDSDYPDFRENDYGLRLALVP